MIRYKRTRGREKKGDRNWRVPAGLFLLLSFVFIFAIADVKIKAAGKSPDFLGKPLEDFSVKTIDKSTFTLSETLKEKDLVMINLWASWCGPCEMEFPAIEKAYEEYKDRVAVLALSVYAQDTDEVLKKYAGDHGMTFPVGRDEGGKLMQFLGGNSIPVTIIVDRFGNIAFFHEGANDNASSYGRIFDYFLSPDYKKTKVLEGIPEKEMPEPVSSAELSAAANGPGSDLVFQHDAGDDNWPMIPVEKDGRKALVSSNGEVEASSSGVFFELKASKGDAIAFDYATSADGLGDGLQVRIDGKLSKCFGGVHDWTSWALALPEGSHKISISFVKDMAYNGPEDCGWISNVRLLSGQEAGKSLDSLPVYPVGDSLKAEILADSAKYIELEHGGQKDQSLGDTPVCLLPGGTKKVPVRVTLPPSMDPEMTVLSIGDSMNFHPVSSYLTEDASGYEFELDLRGDDPEYMNYFQLYYALDEGLGENEERSFATIVLAGKKGLNSYIEMYRNEGYSITGWHYVK